MDKGEILKQLSEAQHKLIDAKNLLNNLASSPIWSEEAFKELDDVVKKKQELDKIVGEIVDIQRKMIMK